MDRQDATDTASAPRSEHRGPRHGPPLTLVLHPAVPLRWLCPQCGRIVWTDEPTPRCGRCGFWDTAS
jgi:ribosomal protein S27AE